MSAILTILHGYAAVCKSMLSSGDYCLRQRPKAQARLESQPEVGRGIFHRYHQRVTGLGQFSGGTPETRRYGLTGLNQPREGTVTTALPVWTSAAPTPCERAPPVCTTSPLNPALRAAPSSPPRLAESPPLRPPDSAPLISAPSPEIPAPKSAVREPPPWSSAALLAISALSYAAAPPLNTLTNSL